VSAEPLSRRTAGLLLAVLTLFAFGVRMRGLDSELPHYTQSDGLILAGQVRRGRTGEEPTAAYGRAARTYPHLLSKLVLLLPDRGRHGPTEGLTEQQHAALASTIWMDLRRMSVWTGTLLVPLTYALARLFLARGPSLFAAAAIATSLLHTSLSQMERPHAAAATLAILAVLAAARLARRPTAGSFVLAGAAAALAIGALHSGVAVLLPLGAAFLLSRRRPQRAPWWWILIGLAIIAVAVRWLYPFSFERGAAGAGPEGLNLSGHQLLRKDFDGSGFLRVLGTMYSYEPVLLLLSVCGGAAALVAFAKRSAPLAAGFRRNLLVAGSYAVPYFLALGIYAQIFERFVLQLLPFFACLSAYGVGRVLRGRGRIAGAVTGALLLALPTALVWKLGSVRAAPDTVERAAAWLEAHVDGEREPVYVLPYLTFPLFYGPQSLERNWRASQHTMWLEYQRELEPGEWTGPRFEIFHPRGKRAMIDALAEDPLEYYVERGARYVVIQQVGEGFKVRALPDTRDALRARAERVLRVSPMAVDDGAADSVGTRYLRNVLEMPYALHLWRARCTGPTLEIYRLP